MSDIFLSYASEDRPRAKLLSDALSALGWSVWWDRTILPGKTFDKVIEDELSATTCVIVMWSGKSVGSPWVRAEAGEALNRGLLIPVLLDDVTIPLVFRQIQAASLADWDGDTSHAGFQQLVRAITALVPLAATEEITPVALAQNPDAVMPQSPTSEPDNHPAAQGQTQGRHVTLPLKWLVVSMVVLIAGAFTWLTLKPDLISSTAPAPAAHVPEAPVVAAIPSPDKSIDDVQAPVTATVKKDLPGEIQKTPPSAEPRPTKAAEPAATKIVAKPPPSVAPSFAPATPPATIPTQDLPQAQISAIAPATEPPIKAAPLSIAMVAWGMPKDEGIADSRQTKAYSINLAQTMAEITKELIPGSTEIIYVYPGQRKHYALMRDKDNFEESMAVCHDTGANIAIFGFVEGSEFDDTIGWLSERRPFFAVFDCKTRQHVSRRYDVYRTRGDSFPYRTWLTKTFRKFAQQDGDFARFATQ
jgi:hypothetical protein